VQTDVLSLNDSVKLPRIERRVMTFAAAERDAIRAALVATKGRINGPGGAAVLLRLKPSTLRAKMKRLDIERDRPPESGGA
jgi:transcriptional regulator with GAF, ATPase, and Fis domain